MRLTDRQSHTLAILERADDGMQCFEVARELGCTMSTARNHLRALNQADAVHVVSVGRSGSPPIFVWYPGPAGGSKALRRYASVWAYAQAGGD